MSVVAYTMYAFSSAVRNRVPFRCVSLMRYMSRVLLYAIVNTRAGLCGLLRTGGQLALVSEYWCLMYCQLASRPCFASWSVLHNGAGSIIFKAYIKRLVHRNVRIVNLTCGGNAFLHLRQTAFPTALWNLSRICLIIINITCYKSRFPRFQTVSSISAELVLHVVASEMISSFLWR